MLQQALCVLIGLFAGVLGGVFGIGGGIVIIPALVAFLGFAQHKAQGTSLVALLLPVGLLGVMNYYRAGNADVKTGLLIGLGFFAGAFAGSKLALGFSDLVMRRSFAAFLVLLGIWLFFRK